MTAMRILCIMTMTWVVTALGRRDNNMKTVALQALRTTTTTCRRNSTSNRSNPFLSGFISSSSSSHRNDKNAIHSNKSFVCLYSALPKRSYNHNSPYAPSQQQQQQLQQLQATEALDLSNPSTYTLATPPPETSLTSTNLPKHQRIVSFGDVHGDLRALYSFLVTAKLVDPSSPMTSPKWTGGSTICVQCGDILDRGDDELACLAVLTSLSRQAKQEGGAVMLLYGNHESLNSVGLFQYANPGGNQEMEEHLGVRRDHLHGKNGVVNNRWRLEYAGNQPARWAAFEPGGWLAKPLLSNMKVSVVVGRTVFVHAGLTREHLVTYDGIGGMNAAAQGWILQSSSPSMKEEDNFQTVEDVIRAAEIKAQSASRSMPDCLGGGIGASSPVWMRDYSSPNDSVPKNPMAQVMIDECLNELGGGVQRMVMGHTPQKQINAALKGKAWRIDVGASRGVMNGTPEVLEIIHGGEDEEDEVWILTKDGQRVPGSHRQVLENLF